MRAYAAVDGPAFGQKQHLHFLFRERIRSRVRAQEVSFLENCTENGKSNSFRSGMLLPLRLGRDEHPGACGNGVLNRAE